MGLWGSLRVFGIFGGLWESLMVFDGLFEFEFEFEFGSNTKSVDNIPKDDDMPQRVKSVKLKTDRHSANKITQHFKPVT